MALAPGTRLGAYEILSLLGAGGMGEVYRARDTRLKRDVAIKILPENFASDPERLARFQREAEILATLNHPNIAQIYGIEDRALVLELVDGPTLADRISKGPIPIHEALCIARQIAEALEAAHERGIIHRDLKPANIKLTSDANVKVLDFGLAKASEAPSPASASQLSQSPTIASPVMTGAHIILGTAAYMSPEQAKGQLLDKRSDVWAFGVVLYEMLTGRRAFDGDHASTMLAAVLMKEPDWTLLPAATPTSIRWLVTRCLAKDPRSRMRDIGDVRLQIDEALAGRAESGPTSSVASAKTGTNPALLAAAVVLTTGVGAAAAWYAKPSGSTPPISLSITLPAGEHVTTVPAISPDGRVVAYAAGRTAATSQLYVRWLDDFSARAVPGSASAQYPFFSPDGRTVAFFADGKLRRASVDGGAPVDLASAPTPWGGTWDSDGRIVFTTNLGAGLFRIPDVGGSPEQLTKPDGGSHGYAHVFPQRLPGTRDLLFAFWGQTFYAARLSASDNSWRPITTPMAVGVRTSGHVFAASGHLLTHDGFGEVVAGRWDPSKSEATSIETPVLKGVNWSTGDERSWIAASDTGTLVYVPGNLGDRHLVWVDRRGQETQLPGEPDLIREATISRDGRRVVQGSLREQWVTDLTTGTRTRITSSDVRAFHGGWLPGDDRIALSSNKDGDWDLFTISAGGGNLKLLLKRPLSQHVQAVAPNGSIVFLERNPESGSDLFLLTPDGKVDSLIVTKFNEESASISPDGRMMAYVSDESGRKNVYAIPMSINGPRTVVSADGGTGPVWSRNGRELFYRTGDDLMSVEVLKQDPLQLGTRRKLLDLSRYDSGYFHEFDVSPDGERFLLIRTEAQSRPTRLDIVLNWFEKLKKQLPVH